MDCKSGLGLGVSRQTVEQERLGGWERLALQEQKAGIRTEAKTSGPPPPTRGCLEPRPGGSYTAGRIRLAWAAGPSQLPAQEEVWGSPEAPGRLASHPPSSPPAHLSQRRAPRGPCLLLLLLPPPLLPPAAAARVQTR